MEPRPDQLHAANPGLIILRTTVSASRSVCATARLRHHRRGHDRLRHQTGQPDGPPTLPSFGLADGLAGVTGAFAVMTALYQRRPATAEGEVIDLSLIEPCWASWARRPARTTNSASCPAGTGNRSVNSAPRNTYLTRDDRWVAVSSAATSVAAPGDAAGRAAGAGRSEPWFDSAAERVKARRPAGRRG
jgi:crotonobetainyl-CoA:carnitine CoA-transferase CaiB-like acyl-CoA transferase